MGVRPWIDDFVGEPGPVHHFYHLIWAHALTGVLLAAVKLDLFTALEPGPMTADEVSGRCGTRPEWTEKLLIACTALGVVQCRDGRYQNTPFAARYLVRHQRAYQGDIITHLQRWERWQELDHCIRTGVRGPKEIRARAEMTRGETQEAHRTWIRAMHNIAMAGQADALVDALDLSGRHLLCDVGGGPGTYAVALCQRYPDLHAIVLDVPETEPIALEIIRSAGLEDRVHFQVGNYLRDDYGKEVDAILFSGVLHGEPPEACGRMLRTAYQSLVPGGLVAVQEILLNDEKPARFCRHCSVFT